MNLILIMSFNIKVDFLFFSKIFVLFIIVFADLLTYNELFCHNCLFLKRCQVMNGLSPANFDIANHIATECAISAQGRPYQPEAVNLRLIRSNLGRYGTLCRDMAGDIKIGRR